MRKNGESIVGEEQDEGFTNDDFVEFITSTQPRCRRPPVPPERPTDSARDRGY